jgi:hypothetical protein
MLRYSYKRNHNPNGVVMLVRAVSRGMNQWAQWILLVLQCKAFSPGLCDGELRATGKPDVQCYIWYAGAFTNTWYKTSRSRNLLQKLNWTTLSLSLSPLWKPTIYCHVHKSPPLSSYPEPDESSPNFIACFIHILILSNRICLNHSLNLVNYSDQSTYALLSSHACYIPGQSKYAWLYRSSLYYNSRCINILRQSANY